MRLSRPCRRRVAPYVLVCGLVLVAACAPPTPRHDLSLDRATAFLVDIFDPELGLLPEYAGASRYWLFHDNYLAAKVLKPTHPDLAAGIARALALWGVTRSGKIEIVCGEARAPLPFRVPELVRVATRGGKQIWTERLTARPSKGWAGYADLLLLAALAEAQARPERAEAHLATALGMWDSAGFRDAATEHLARYSTYKLALALLAARELARPLPMREAILRRLARQQEASGGFVTDYDATGRPIGKANVETTCLVILALQP